jgi:hypothetical protein
MTDCVARLRTQLVTAVEKQPFRKWTAPKRWFASSSDSLTAICTLAADEPVECIEVSAPDEPVFFDDLQASTRAPQRRFELLTTRYLHPLNIAAPSEQRVREHLLERVMVADRSRLEQHSVQLLNADDFLLRLNLIAIYASFTADLRYLDALNYYYESLPSSWCPASTHNWLRVSFLNFYVRALAVHFILLIKCVLAYSHIHLLPRLGLQGDRRHARPRGVTHSQPFPAQVTSAQLSGKPPADGPDFAETF